MLVRLDDCMEKIERYLNSSDVSPRLVNVRSKEDLAVIVRRFYAGNHTFLKVADFAGKDENVRLEDLQRELSIGRGSLFITGLTSYLKLLGEKALQRELQSFVTQTFNAHVVVLCYQCEKYLQFADRRAERLVYSVESGMSAVPEIIFTASELPVPLDAVPVEGVQNLAAALEEADGDKLYVKTKKRRGDYPNTLLYIREESGAFDALKSLDPATHSLAPSLGSDEQWTYALRLMGKAGSWGEAITDQFGRTSHLEQLANNWKHLEANKKWLYFIALKLYGAGENWCLNEAVSCAAAVDELLQGVYRGLLSVSPGEASFWAKYDERKKLIDALGSSDEQVIDCLKALRGRGGQALYYLTDGSRMEKERIFELLNQYADHFERTEVESILSHVYPDLYLYLRPYPFQNETLFQYFQDYKYQKVVNKIYPEFLALVEAQAKSRDFNLWLPPRCEKIEGLDKTGARLYFVDAMGAEYLGFVLARCEDLKLMANISVCRCELPSITEPNKEFLKEFTDIAPCIKRLDTIKHHGDESFHYETVKLPIHLIRELEIVSEVLTEIRNKLQSGEIERAYIIADHGASRLSVIHETENKWEMASKGEHSGRCCPVSEADVQSEYATKENNFWVLANYDRFKGGRRACVEVHGGATLEEVTVPIIEFTWKAQRAEVSICSKLPIEISFRTKAELQLVSTEKLGDVTVCVTGKKIDALYYGAEPQGDDLYLVRMPDVKRAGEYLLKVFSNNNQVAELPFTVKKEGVSERSIL